VTKPSNALLLPAGPAKGSLTYDGATAQLKFVAASATGRTRGGEFVDQEDDGKPIVLVTSDQKLPVEKWEKAPTSSF
jgi:hypothetical protein